MKPKKDKRIFRKTAQRTRAINIKSSMRGGIRF